MDIKIGILIVSFFSVAFLEQEPTNTEVNTHDCKLMFTYGYGYNKFFHISESGGQNGSDLNIRFLVRARSDAHILLSSVPAPVENQPVYEVVIGAGKNTYSDIRRIRRSATKATKKTLDLLSPVELRGFWVHLNGKGLIEVGKEGDELPFIFWTDPTPLVIHYFSFCTWAGVVGKWLYDCPIANNTEQIEVVEPKPTTMTDKLRKDLLTNYNPYSLPVLQKDHVIAVYMRLNFHHVKMDVKNSVFSVDGVIPMHWTDEKIHWKPEDYGNLTSIHVKEHEVWIPEVVLYNAIGHGANILGHGGMTITSEGIVMWSPTTHLEVWCNADLSKWPNDLHICQVQLGFWSQQQFLQLLIIENYTVMEDEQRTGSEWEVVKIESETVIVQTPWNEDIDIYDSNMSTSGTLTIHITVQRQSHPYHIVFIAPLLVINVLILLTFWISPMNYGKLGLLCLCLILLAHFTVTIVNALPASSDQVPCLVVTYNWSMIAAVFSVSVSVFIICITRYAHAAPPPSFLCTVITYPTVQKLLFLPEVSTEAGKTYNQLRESLEVNESCPGVTTLTSSSKYQEIQQYWVILGIATDRISSLFYFIFIICILTKQK